MENWNRLRDFLRCPGFFINIRLPSRVYVIRRSRFPSYLRSHRSSDVTPRFPVRPNWRIRTEFGARDYILRLFTCFFFLLRAELVPVGIQTISVITKNHLHVQKNYHRSGVHQNLYTYTESHLVIHIHI